MVLKQVAIISKVVLKVTLDILRVGVNSTDINQGSNRVIGNSLMS